MGLPLRPETLDRLNLGTLSGGSELDDPPPEGDHGGLGAVLGAKLREDVADLALDRVLADRELGGDLLVGVTLGNQAHDTDFRSGQRLVGRMLGELVRNLWRERLLTGVDGSNGAQELLMQSILEQIRSGARLERA